MDDTSADNLTLQVKTSKEVKTVIISNNATVIELKAEVAKAFNASTEQLCLICQGKIMRDIEILSSYTSLPKNPNIGLVIKGASKKVVNPASTVSSVANADPSVNESKQAPSANQQSASASLNRQKLDEGNITMASQLMKNLPSEYLDMIIKQNPMIKKLCEENPELRTQMTGNNIKKMAEILANPTMAAELMRSQENMIQQIQNIPGAASHLERMMSSLPDTQTENPYVYDSSNAAASSRHDNVRPNLSGEPVPNPWDQPARAPSNQQSGEGLGPAGFPNLSNWDYSELANLFAGSNNPGEENALFDATQLDRAFQEALFASSTNKKTEDQPNNNPTPNLAPNDNANTGPIFNQSIVADLLKPDVMKAFLDITKNMEIIKREAPHLIPSMSRMIYGQGSPLPPNLSHLIAPNPSSSFSNDFSAPTEANQLQRDPTQPIATNEQLKERFREQLNNLKDMGLTDEELNIRALEIGGGNVQLALEWLFKNNFI